MDLKRRKKVDEITLDLVSHGCGLMKEVQLKFLIIGDFGVGKTAIVRRYVDGRFSSNYKITIGADFALKSILWDEKTRINLQLWDIAGHERFGYMTRVYYKYAVAAAVVFDLTRSATIHSVRKWLQDLREKVMLNDGSAVPVVLLANKCDVHGCEIPTDIINRLCKDYHIDAWFVTSARDNINIEEAFKFLMKQSLQVRSHEPAKKVEGLVLNSRPIFDNRPFEDRHICCQ